MTSTIKVDTISEKTSANGVSIDSVILKDGAVDVQGVSDGIIIDADGDTTISADTDDQIDIKVGGTDVVKITAATLDVTGPGNTGGIININNTDTEGANTDNIGRINFVGNDGSSSASGTRAAIETEVTSNFGSTQLNIEVAASGAAAAKIATFSPDGLSLADGNITFEGSGHGIHLGVTSATAANLLDDYEEGTWTPSNSDVSLGVTSAVYVKVGHLCHVQAYVTFPSNSNGSGAQIEGLPFTAGASFAYLTGRAEGQSSQIVIQVNSGTTEADIYNEADSGLANSALSGSYFLFSGTYVTT